MTWRELLDETLRVSWPDWTSTLDAAAIGDALWEIGSVWDRASEAQEYPDSETPALDDDTGYLVEVAVERVIGRISEA